MSLMVITKLIIMVGFITLCDSGVNLTCSKNIDCPMNSSCETGHVCFCHEGFIDDINTTLRCLKEARELGDECEKDIQCNGLLGLRSHCHRHDPSDRVLGKCVCNSDSHYKEGICHKRSYIGDKCVVSSDCFIQSTHIQSYCDHSKCICPPKHAQSQDRKDCLPQTGLDEKCDANSICMVPNSKCDQYCHCKLGFVPSKDNKHCLQAADRLDDSCQDDSQCSEFLSLSRCDTRLNKCSCQPFAHRLDGRCWLTVELNGLCEHDSECFAGGDREGVECKQGVCSCKPPYSLSGKSCIAINEAGFGEGSWSAASLSMRNSLLLSLASGMAAFHIL